LIEIDNHYILHDLYYLLDHAFLTINIFIIEEFIQDKWQTIIKDSKEKENFISNLTKVIRNIDISNIPDKEFLKLIVQEYIRILESTWYKYLQCVNITKYSKVWWNEKCQVKLSNYRSFKMIEDWKIFKEVIKKTKCLFFNDEIQEIALINQRPWDLINWVKKCKLPAIEVLQYNSQLCIKINDL